MANRISSYPEDTELNTIWFLTGIFILFLFIIPSEPIDDLLRHLLAYKHHYNYAEMVAYAKAPRYDPYIIFDVLVGRLHFFFGQGAYVFVQAANILLFGIGVYWLSAGASNNLRFIITMVACLTIMPRLLLARPAGFESDLLLIAYAASQEAEKKAWWHVSLGIAMASLYHLFWIYLIPLAFFRRIYAIPLIAGIIGWTLYGGTEYYVTTWGFLTAKQYRLIPVIEASTIIPYLLSNSWMFIPLIYHWRKERLSVGMILYFCASNQVRYIETIAPLALVATKHIDFKPTKIMVMVTFLAVCLWRGNSTEWYSSSFKNMFPDGSIVIDLTANANYRILYSNPTIKIIPAFEYAWNDRAIQQAIVKASKDGEFNCQLLQNYKIDFIVESNLKKIPKCITLDRITTTYRIWRPSIEKQRK